MRVGSLRFSSRLAPAPPTHNSHFIDYVSPRPQNESFLPELRWLGIRDSHLGFEQGTEGEVTQIKLPARYSTPSNEISKLEVLIEEIED